MIIQLWLSSAKQMVHVTATKSGMDPVELKNTATSGTFKVTSSGVDYESKLWYKTGKVTTSN